MHNTDTEIYNERIIQAPLSKLYSAFADPAQLAQWWGPKGYTNTMHEFDLRTGGNWRLTMHGPEKGHYENASVFDKVEEEKLIAWTRKTQPYFKMEIGFEAINDSSSRISFRMIFDTPEGCAKVKNFAGPANEENFDRLERLFGY